MNKKPESKRSENDKLKLNRLQNDHTPIFLFQLDANPRMERPAGYFVKCKGENVEIQDCGNEV